MTDQPVESEETTPYRVLARKYRPARFADLIGQEALVRTLTNAIESGRLAHAFILTGVRGVGKTTTARIIARALNCVGSDGKGGPTPEPCGACEHCLAIAQDRHVDVIEMDAASRTGIDDIRELIDGVRYRPVSARNKIYIIDEVHMLSKPAFNALLKTLEEPPEHVIFIFATTEIRKVPVTVLSRCQRFDLRRVDHDVLVAHFAAIAEEEGVAVPAEALAMIARAADGSVRDGLSLLDQAIALGGAGKIDEGQVRDMLGLADRAVIFDLFDALMRGAAPEALTRLNDLYAAGADPAVVLQDLLELTHSLTRAKLVPETLDAPGVPETERVQGRAMAEKLSLPVLARTWQMLLKGLAEAQAAPSRLQAAEMVLIRLTHASDLPSPADLVKQLQDSNGGAEPAAASRSSAAAPVSPQTSGSGPGTAVARQATEATVESQHRGGPQAALAQQLAPEVLSPEALNLAPDVEIATMPESFAAVVDLARAHKEGILANQLSKDVHLVRFEPGRIEFRPSASAPSNLAGSLGRLLQDWTGQRWVVSVSSEDGAPPLREQRDATEARLREEAMRHALVQAALKIFPGAKLVARRGGPPGDQQGDQPADHQGDAGESPRRSQGDEEA